MEVGTVKRGRSHVARHVGPQSAKGALQLQALVHKLTVCAQLSVSIVSSYYATVGQDLSFVRWMAAASQHNQMASPVTGTQSGLLSRALVIGRGWQVWGFELEPGR